MKKIIKYKKEDLKLMLFCAGTLINIYFTLTIMDSREMT